MSYSKPPTPVSVPGLWLTTFSATLAAVLVGGLILGIGLRFYLHWSVSDTASKVGQEWKKKEPEPKPAN